MSEFKQTCLTCNLEKPLTEFHKSKQLKIGYIHYCKVCIKEKGKKYYLENKNKIDEYNKKWSENNKDKSRAHWKKYAKTKNNIINKRDREKRSQNPVYKLNVSVSNLIKGSFKSKKFHKTSKSQEILGCDYQFFKLYIESKFEDWMVWDNYGKYNGELNFGWDLDHIIPISSAKTKEDIIKLNHYTNFRPLCSKVNRYIKRNKLNFKINNYGVEADMVGQKSG